MWRRLAARRSGTDLGKSVPGRRNRRGLPTSPQFSALASGSSAGDTHRLTSVGVVVPSPRPSPSYAQLWCPSVAWSPPRRATFGRRCPSSGSTFWPAGGVGGGGVGGNPADRVGLAWRRAGWSPNRGGGDRGGPSLSGCHQRLSTGGRIGRPGPPAGRLGRGGPGGQRPLGGQPRRAGVTSQRCPSERAAGQPGPATGVDPARSGPSAPGQGRKLHHCP